MRGLATPVFAVLTGLGILVSASADARELSIVASELPPMFTKNGSGHEADIVRETLAACGHSVKFTVVPFIRNLTEFKKGAYDAVATVPSDIDLGGQKSAVYFQYQNGASVLASSGITINSLSDLAGKRVISFANARKILPGLHEAAGSFADYRENAGQLIHSKLLFAARVDVVLGDGLIFAEYNRQLRERAKGGEGLPFNPHQNTIFTAIFPPTSYVMVFKDGAVRDDFNHCFQQLSESGRIAAILKEAVEPYRDTLGAQYLPPSSLRH
jgi:polar amino acid transport system substrate-binding protein